MSLLTQLDTETVYSSVCKMFPTEAYFMLAYVVLFINICQQPVDSKMNNGRRLVLDSDVETANAGETLMSRMVAIETEMNRLRDDLKRLQSVQTGGSVYTRWGRTVCPTNGTELVYSGYTGGTRFDTRGAADYICLSGEPLWAHYDDSAQGHALKISGTEYEFYYQFADSGASFFGKNLHNHDAPCAVCRSSRSTTVMIPGRNQCYPGWTMEYWGYLVSGFTGQPSTSNFACLDSNPEWESGDISNDDGKLIYIVEAMCGSLKCPPYVPNREITCVVCSK